MVATQKVQIPHSIWSDPEFTTLSAGAQLLWFWLKTRRRPTRFRPERVAELTGWRESNIESWAAELAQTSYSSEFTRTRRLQTVAREVRAAIYNRDGHRCAACGSADDLTIDHIYPVSLGGSDDPANLQTLCRPCNCRKGARV